MEGCLANLNRGLFFSFFPFPFRLERGPSLEKTNSPPANMLPRIWPREKTKPRIDAPGKLAAARFSSEAAAAGARPLCKRFYLNKLYGSFFLLNSYGVNLTGLRCRRKRPAGSASFIHAFAPNKKLNYLLKTRIFGRCCSAEALRGFKGSGTSTERKLVRSLQTSRSPCGQIPTASLLRRGWPRTGVPAGSFFWRVLSCFWRRGGAPQGPGDRGRRAWIFAARNPPPCKL